MQGRKAQVNEAASAAKTVYQYNYLKHKNAELAIQVDNALKGCGHYGLNCTKQRFKQLLAQRARLVSISKRNTKALMKACQSGDTQACAQKTNELAAYDKRVSEDDVDGEDPQYSLGAYSVLGIDKALGRSLGASQNQGKRATDVVQHFVLKRGHHQGELSSVADAAGVLLSGVAAVGGCVATAGIPCVIAGVAGGLGAINSTNHLYGDVQQVWTGQAHSTALSSAAIALGASSSTAGAIQRGFDIATLVSSALDLGLGAASLVKLPRVGDEFSSVAAGSQAEKLNSSVIRSNTEPAPQTIDLNAFERQTEKALVGQKSGVIGNYSTEIDDKVKVIQTNNNIPITIKDSFLDSNYRTVVTNEDVTAYRVYGGKAAVQGGFASTKSALNKIQAKIDAALLPEWKNTREFEAEILIPKGTELNIGKVAPQTIKSSGTVLDGKADQLLLPHGWPKEWIKTIKKVAP